GGFAIVFAAYDNANKWYALKRQITKDRQSMEAVISEIRIHKELTGHPAILKFIAAAQMKTSTGCAEFLLLTELCSGGSVADLMKNIRLIPEQVLKVFYAAAMAVSHMHTQVVPITHRDIKIENLLFDSSGHVKLCDFGSATVEVYAPDDTWNAAQRTWLEEEMQRHTTPMYRAPEILDTYQNFVVGPPQDIWALGCVLFYLCYHVHPFEDSAKLRILNVVYTVPNGFEEFADILPVIESCLQVDPLSRPTAKDLLEQIEALAVTVEVDLRKPVSGINTGLLKKLQTQRFIGGSSSNASMPHPSRVSIMPEDVTEHASAINRSSAVVQKVQAKLVPQEVTWVTSRMCVVPVTSATIEESDEDEWSSRVAASCQVFAVYNLSTRSLRVNCTVEPMASAMNSVYSIVPPSVEGIVEICSSVVSFLRSHPSAAVIFFGLEAHCVLLCAALLIYCKLINEAIEAFEFVANKRQTVLRISPSQIRTIDLLKNLVSLAPVVSLPKSRPMLLCSISLSTLPILAGIRSGLKPVIEVFVGTTMVWDSIGSQSELVVSDSLCAELPVNNVRLDGQVAIILSCCRSNPAHSPSKKALFCLVFHTSMANDLMKFTRTDVDINAGEESNVPCDFRIALELRPIPHEDIFNTPKHSDVRRSGSPELLVLDYDEQKRVMCWRSTSTNTSASVVAAQYERSEMFRLPSDVTTDFFQTLDWSQVQNHVEHAAPSPVPPSLPPHRCPPASSLPHPRGEGQAADPFTLLTTSSDNQPASLSMVTSSSWSIPRPLVGLRTQQQKDANAGYHQFDYGKETPILSAFTPPCAISNDSDLLDLGELPELSVVPGQAVVDPLSNSNKNNWTTPSATALVTASEAGPCSAHQTNGNLFDLSNISTSLSIHRNVSAPAFQQNSKDIDPFAEFLSQSASNPVSAQALTFNSESTTPMPSRPNYSRTAFDNLNSSTTVEKAKVTGDVFGDLLTSHGFTASRNASRTLGDMTKAKAIKDMDPVTLKVRDWAGGKERNIRALLGSLNDVLWEGAEKWQQPRIGDLLSAAQVRRSYYKACLVVHPDKQVGEPHEELARAIFTELNEAWNAFEKTGGESL
ncbi:hypothetical protein V3C99_018649, partial [Haemonchus contortus]